MNKWRKVSDTPVVSGTTQLLYVVMLTRRFYSDLQLSDEILALAYSSFSYKPTQALDRTVLIQVRGCQTDIDRSLFLNQIIRHSNNLPTEVVYAKINFKNQIDCYFVAT